MVIAVQASDPGGRRSATMIKPELLLAAPGSVSHHHAASGLRLHVQQPLAAAHVSARRPVTGSGTSAAPMQLHDLLSATSQHSGVASHAAPATVGIIDACIDLEKILGRPTCP
jgi:hypothetical protein